jgi:sugar phosphate isomerase/epimerase
MKPNTRQFLLTGLAWILLSSAVLAQSISSTLNGPMSNTGGAAFPGAHLRASEPQPPQDIFSKSNLAAWCIVPFDVQHRGPVARAEMLNQLGITKLAYDWRTEHIPTFDAEVDATKSHHIQLIAFWMEAGKDPAHQQEVQVVLDLMRRRHLKLQLWVMYVPEKDFDSLSQDEKIAQVSKTISYLASEAAKTASSVALYNHGGWYGEPDNQLAILDRVKAKNVGLVYNFNHAQEQIDGFPEFFPRILPHLVALNLAGLREGDSHIFPIGQGGSEQKMISIVWKSSYRGPVGIINEDTNPDAEVGLRMNMTGLERILSEMGDTAALATYR